MPRGKYIEERILQRTIEMTDKESKAYEKYAKEGVFTCTDIYNGKDKKHARFIRMYLYRKVEIK